MSRDDEWFHFQVDEREVKRERAKARELRGSQWWKSLIGKGICHYCSGRFPPAELSMDHVVPLARGGKSTKGNIVPACKKCNQEKRLATPVERILQGLAKPDSGNNEDGGESEP